MSFFVSICHGYVFIVDLSARQRDSYELRASIYETDKLFFQLDRSELSRGRIDVRTKASVL